MPILRNLQTLAYHPVKVKRSRWGNNAFDFTVGGKNVGRASLADNPEPGHAPFLDSVRLERKHLPIQLHDKPIAHHLYDSIEKQIGQRLVPSPLGLSDKATKFWHRRLKAMPEEEHKDLLAKAKANGLTWGISEKHIDDRLAPLHSRD